MRGRVKHGRVHDDEIAFGASHFLEPDRLAAGLRIPKETPPIFLAHGGDDIVSPPEHSVVMYQALRRGGAKAELHIYADSTHDFGVRRVGRPCDAWTQACADWLRHLGLLGAPAAEKK